MCLFVCVCFFTLIQLKIRGICLKLPKIFRHTGVSVSVCVYVYVYVCVCVCVCVCMCMRVFVCCSVLHCNEFVESVENRQEFSRHAGMCVLVCVCGL